MLARASKVTKSHGNTLIFEELDFEIRAGERIALIGENGSGKSTLFQLLSGLQQPDTGTISVAHGASVGYLGQEPGDYGQRTVFEVAMEADQTLADIRQQLSDLELKLEDSALVQDSAALEKLLDRYGRLQERFATRGGYEYEAKVRGVLSGLRFKEGQFSQPVSNLSGGERKLVSLARILVMKPDILLLDEPDSHLDLEAKSWLEQYMLGHSGAVAVISHDRYFLDNFINHIFELEDGRLYDYPCNYSGFREAKQERLEREIQVYRLQQRQLKQLERSAEQLSRWAALNKKFAKRARSRRRMLDSERERLESVPRPVRERSTMQLEFEQQERSGRRALEVHGLAMAYGDRDIFTPFNLIVQYGDRIGLVGPNGSGKTTLFRILLGEETPAQGEIRFGANVKVGYYSQDQESLLSYSSPLDYIRRVKPMHEEQAVAFLKSRLLLEYDECFGPIASLSGGQRSRLQLAGLALTGVNFLLLDEPTNNLDIPSMMVLEDALLDFEGTIITISHDRYFLDIVIDKILAIIDAEIFEYPGSFTEFYEAMGGKVDIGTVGPKMRP